MGVYKFADGRKGWYFQGYYKGKKYKKESWKKKHMDTKSEALACEREYIQEVDRCKTTDKKMTVENLFNSWISTMEDINRSPSTLNNYKKVYRNYLKPIYKTKCYKLQSEDTQKLVENISKTDTSVDYKNKTVSVIRFLFEYGIDNFNLDHDILRPLKTKIVDYSPRTIKSDSRVYNKDEIVLFLSSLDDVYWKTLFEVLFFTGIRIGELCALTLESYSSTDKTLSITKNIIRVDGIDVLKSPKCDRSLRVIYLDDSTNESLKTYIGLLIESGFEQTDFIFGRNKKSACQQDIRRKCQNISKKLNLPKIKIHEIRKSHASYLRDMGYDELSISKRLGNTPKVASEVYIKISDNEMKNMAEKIRK